MVACTAPAQVAERVQFHTGRELTADDIVWNVKRATGDNKLNAGVWVATFRPMTSVTVNAITYASTTRITPVRRVNTSGGGRLPVSEGRRQ